jgi:hypothetical protein
VEYIYNPHPAGRPYGEEPFGLWIWGADGIYDVTVEIRGSAPVARTNQKIIKARYRVNARPTGLEPTIEDIYSYATYRYMALACLDGPLLPFKDEEVG